MDLLRACRLSILILPLLGLGDRPALAADPPAAAEREGDLWEVTSNMKMEGVAMQLPSQTTTACTEKEWKVPPGGAAENQGCRVSDFEIKGTTTTWTMSCDGPPAMTGKGRITRQSPDAYSGALELASERGKMTIELAGRRVGVCKNPS